ncbi:MAG: dTMP kinase [Planctomycetes bacterium]|jgi:dTMP kinase|nr:dTMP kinase [Planctomycetota bacterium]
MRGRFIVIEGIDGTGKSTLAAQLAQALRARGRDVLLTNEPTRLPSGRLILERLTDKSLKLTAHEWLGMFVCDRRMNIDTIVKPALERGTDVIQDRSFYSTLVYQGEMGISAPEILRRHEGWHPKPDLVVILDIAPRFGLARTRKRTLGVGQRYVRQHGQKWIFNDGDAPQSTEKLAFLQRIRRRYARIKGPNIVHISVRRHAGEDWQDKTTDELVAEVLHELDIRSNPREVIDNRRYAGDSGGGDT